MTYEQNLKQKAEQLVKEKYKLTHRIATQPGNLSDWSTKYYKRQYEYLIEQMMPIAAQALEWCAESITTAMAECMPQETDAYSKGDLKYVIQGYLASNGLIPPIENKQP